MKKFYVIALMLMMSVTSVSAHASSYSYSIGTNYGDGVDTSSSAKNAATNFTIAGYTSYYNIKPTISYLEGNNADGQKRLESDIVFLAGHANYDSMAWNYLGNGGNYNCGVYYKQSFQSSSSDTQYVGINDLDLSDTELITFAGCKTANNSTNLLTKAVAAGADVAVGFEDSIGTTSATEWRGHYVSGLALGKSVSQAISYADNNFSYDDDSVKTSTYEGTGSTVIKISSKSSIQSNTKYDIKTFIDAESELADGSLVLDIKPAPTHEIKDKISVNVKLGKYDKLSEYIVNNINSNFNIDSYETNVYVDDNGIGTITFTLLIGDFKTDVQYNVAVKKDIATAITTLGDHSILSSKDDSIFSNKIFSNQSIDVNTVKQLAIDASELGSKCKVSEQKVSKKFDTETKEGYYFVLTEFEFADGSFMVEEFKYTIK